MKITIEPTQNDATDWKRDTIIVETPHDELSKDELISLIARVIFSAGYNHADALKFLQDVAEFE